MIDPGQHLNSKRTPLLIVSVEYAGVSRDTPSFPTSSWIPVLECQVYWGRALKMTVRPGFRPNLIPSTDVATQELRMIACFLFGAYPTSPIQSLNVYNPLTPFTSF